jgi:hypothetical protein
VLCSSQLSADLPFSFTLHFTIRWSRGCLRVTLLILDVMHQVTSSWSQFMTYNAALTMRKSIVCSVLPSGLVCDKFYSLSVLALFCNTVSKFPFSNISVISDFITAFWVHQNDVYEILLRYSKVLARSILHNMYKILLAFLFQYQNLRLFISGLVDIRLLSTLMP